MNVLSIIRSTAILLCGLLFFSWPAAADTVWVVPVKGAIGPASSDYISREIEQAQSEGVSLVILKMDTPGGLDSAMRDIIRAITTSAIPVATWVGPSGSRAASAGTYILLASHIASMAEATNLGAATPVAIGGGQAPGSPSKPGSPTDDEDPASKETSEEKATERSEGSDTEKVPSNTAMEKKVINDARAYIKGLARLHGRNAEWAEKAVSEAASLDATEAASLDATEALELGVIDFIANSPEELVTKADGREISINSNKVTLSLQDPVWVERAPDWRAEMLAVITNPNVAYILMLIGIYGLLLEFYNPGIGLPGVLGGICLLLAMYALQMMPVNYAGLGLILLGIALMVAEAFSPSFGILGLGGIVAFVLGSIFLMDSDLPGYQVAIPLIAGVAIFSLALILLMVTMLLKIRRRKVTTGVQTMAGKRALVADDFIDGEGRVQMDGTFWTAHSETPLKKGDLVTVEEIRGLKLSVSPRINK